MAIKKVKYSLNSIEGIFKEKHINTAKIKTISQDPFNEGNVYKRKEMVEIDFNNSLVVDSSQFAEFMDGLRLDRSTLLFHAQFSSPRSNLTAVDNSDYGTLTYGISPMYNYYAPQYERLIQDMPESELINAYVSSKNGANDDKGHLRHFSNTSITEETFKKAFQRESKVSYLPVTDELIASSEIIYPQGYNFLDISPYKKRFPFGIDISVGVDNSNKKFKTFLNKTEMYEIFVQGYLSAAKERINMNATFNSNYTQTSAGAQLFGANLLNMNLNNFLALPSSPSRDYFSPLKDSSMHGLGLKLGLLVGFMRQLTLEEMSSFADMASGKKNYYEPIFYKIQKVVGTSSGRVTQTYIIPADNKLVNYFDTQIKAGTVYSYRITECAIVMGNSAMPLGQIVLGSNAKSQFEVEISPSLYMVEVPIVGDTVATVSDPSYPPKMEFYTKNDFENKIFMRLYTSGVGQIEDNYHMVLDSDASTVEMLRYKNRFFDKYKFQNKNNKIEAYEVLRLSERPDRIVDFANGLRYLIDDEIIFDSATVSTTIKPNKKYYYLCRSINQHGLLSNHSVVYEVELLKSSSTSRVVVKSYKFNLQSKPHHSRNMTRLLQVIPHSQHTTYDPPLETESFKKYLNKVTLGSAGFPIWGEEFKIRLTSNNTGRKIDFNVVFNLIKKKTIEEIK